MPAYQMYWTVKKASNDYPARAFRLQFGQRYVVLQAISLTPVVRMFHSKVLKKTPHCVNPTIYISHTCRNDKTPAGKKNMQQAPSLPGLVSHYDVSTLFSLRVSSEIDVDLGHGRRTA